MVNAVLRKLAGQKAPAAKVFETPAQFAERLGHPDWLVERWAKTYGPGAAKAICEYDQRLVAVAPVAAEASAPEGEGAAGESVEAAAVASPVADDASAVADAPVVIEVPAIEAVSDPVTGPVIDPGSRLVAELAAALAPERDGPLAVWDACAAPGGKTMVLAELLPTAAILATDASPRRLKAMAERIEQVGLAGRIRAEEGDATAPAVGPGEFDLILCDAPCSGTGTLARNPEIRLRLEPEDLPRQVKRQREILRSALGRLKPGGRLLYSTCSLEPEENEDVMEWVMKRVDGIQRIALFSYVTRLAGAEKAAALVRNGCLRTLPGANLEGDGFFAVAFERVR